MYSKSRLIKTVQKEINIIKHLYEKIDPSMHDYRPTEKQRSIKELLHYLAHIITAQIHAIKEGNAGPFEGWNEKLAGTDLNHFLEMMDHQSQEMEKLINEMSDEELNHEIELWGFLKDTRSHLLVEMLLHQLIAYKMQLFLYAKAAGRTDLTSGNLWMGVDKM